MTFYSGLPPLAQILITIIALIGIIVVFKWFIEDVCGWPIPKPLRIVACAIIAIVAIGFLARFI